MSVLSLVSKGVSESGALTFDEVIAAHGAAMARVAAAHEKVIARREELVQEILLAVWQALPKFRGECSLKTFVLRIAHHRAVDHVLRERRHAVNEPLTDEAIIEGVPLEAQINNQRKAQQLLDAVHTLPTGQRELVALALEGCSHQEIADIIGISVNNVTVRLSRARTKIINVMEPKYE